MTLSFHLLIQFIQSWNSIARTRGSLWLFRHKSGVCMNFLWSSELSFTLFPHRTNAQFMCVRVMFAFNLLFTVIMWNQRSLAPKPLRGNSCSCELHLSNLIWHVQGFKVGNLYYLEEQFRDRISISKSSSCYIFQCRSYVCSDDITAKSEVR